MAMVVCDPLVEFLEGFRESTLLKPSNLLATPIPSFWPLTPPSHRPRSTGPRSCSRRSTPCGTGRRWRGPGSAFVKTEGTPPRGQGPASSPAAKEHFMCSQWEPTLFLEGGYSTPSPRKTG